MSAMARDSAEYGISLMKKEIIKGREVMPVLKALELAHEGVGRALLQTFFPCGTTDEDEAWWKAGREDKAIGFAEEQETVEKIEVASALRDDLARGLEERDEYLPKFCLGRYSPMDD